MILGAPRIWGTLVVVFALTALDAQPPPPKPESEAIERRIREVRNRLSRNLQDTPRQKELAAFAHKYLEAAARAHSDKLWYQADRFADAADACRRPLDHLDHVAGGGHPKPPPDLGNHLRQVYFRLRLGSVFLQQIPPPEPKRILELARGFYDQALKAQESGNLSVADEYAKSADDLTHALESLAQAAIPNSAAREPR